MIIPVHDIKSGFIVVAAGATVVAMAIFVYRQFVRTFTLRKDPSVALYERFGTSSISRVAGSHMTTASATTAAPAPEPASALDPGDLTDETSPIDPSEATPYIAMRASEDVLRRDWDSPEEDEAWAHL